MEPDLKKSGYTISFAKFTPLPTDDPNITNALSALVSSMGIRMKVTLQLTHQLQQKK
ncbi:mucus-binding protein [Lactobacillus amylovorus]|uniref:mucus-binding protein n=1 Tax=Lactobacillus amylovorus TaxID=1604 RepID=UPI00233051EE|nr:mucus-binding protein [Lactobacillus amylovorus]MDB6248168.1 mucus-binding protein [Lactobacillus amylovorus]MDB6259726.1 mucus-binding protein [Lactobacillus amylovorus]MDB6263603.1 mucus-binding protein [Lactobacillus amylovorus]MDB6267299.1 mucus-binding protein [Lactobacillus amylovorus]MDB6269294.1 mucus-binding protein [Lactobacillus amylovorus]